MLRPAVVDFNRPPVFRRPVHVTDAGLLDLLVMLAGHSYRDGQPLGALGRFDLVAGTPICTCVSHVIIQNEFVNGSDKVRITLQGDTIRLQNCGAFQGNSTSFARTCLASGWHVPVALQLRDRNKSSAPLPCARPSPSTNPARLPRLIWCLNPYTASPE